MRSIKLIRNRAVTSTMNGEFSNCRASPPQSRPWRKVLHENQDVADNYVDVTFLREMKKNLFIREYDYYTLMVDTGHITQQINSVVMFVMSFTHLQSSLLDPYILNIISCAVVLLAFLFAKSDTTASIDLKAVIVFCTAAFVLSPVLLSLTETISTDTIYAMTSLMLLVHLISHDYQQEAENVSGVVSFNAGIFATVCLTSRLDSLYQGFSLVILAVVIFGVWPSSRRDLRCFYVPYIDLMMTFSMFLITVCMVWTQTVSLAIVLALIFVFITFVCPYLLIHLQPIKNNVYGPWDEAVVAEKS